MDRLLDLYLHENPYEGNPIHSSHSQQQLYDQLSNQQNIITLNEDELLYLLTQNRNQQYKQQQRHHQLHHVNPTPAAPQHPEARSVGILRPQPPIDLFPQPPNPFTPSLNQPTLAYDFPQSLKTALNEMIIMQTLPSSEDLPAYLMMNSKSRLLNPSKRQYSQIPKHNTTSTERPQSYSQALRSFRYPTKSNPSPPPPSARIPQSGESQYRIVASNSNFNMLKINAPSKQQQTPPRQQYIPLITRVKKSNPSIAQSISSRGKQNSQLQTQRNNFMQQTTTAATQKLPGKQKLLEKTQPFEAGPEKEATRPATTTQFARSPDKSIGDEQIEEYYRNRANSTLSGTITQDQLPTTPEHCNYPELNNQEKEKEEEEYEHEQLQPQQKVEKEVLQQTHQLKVEDDVIESSTPSFIVSVTPATVANQLQPYSNSVDTHIQGDLNPFINRRNITITKDKQTSSFYFNRATQSIHQETMNSIQDDTHDPIDKNLGVLDCTLELPLSPIQNLQSLKIHLQQKKQQQQQQHRNRVENNDLKQSSRLRGSSILSANSCHRNDNVTTPIRNTNSSGKQIAATNSKVDTFRSRKQMNRIQMLQNEAAAAAATTTTNEELQFSYSETSENVPTRPVTSEQQATTSLQNLQLKESFLAYGKKESETSIPQSNNLSHLRNRASSCEQNRSEKQQQQYIITPDQQEISGFVFKQLFSKQSQSKYDSNSTASAAPSSAAATHGILPISTLLTNSKYETTQYVQQQIFAGPYTESASVDTPVQNPQQVFLPGMSSSGFRAQKSKRYSSRPRKTKEITPISLQPTPTPAEAAFRFSRSNFKRTTPISTRQTTFKFK